MLGSGENKPGIVSLREKGVDLNVNGNVQTATQVVSLREKGVDLNNTSGATAETCAASPFVRREWI